ncbi:BPTD_3080 family restriction endonuclease [Afifella sp. IM 167]|uniref:BPTD_3080 family restriction endonuclease n=1 Tax=Afifella sp. IM 167 TaxID=2033586 RepID=UPI001CC9658D|nr:DEAD/DEAH box helicase family protein [Afifella sp. IM 167]MBZ8134390.1 restriction endonuclease [Afifella sp. IM 167]
MSEKTQKFFEEPILNSPYEEPSRHWELDLQGRPTDVILPLRRKAELISAIPGPRKRNADQRELVYDTGHGLSTDEQEFNPTPIINELRQEIETWRRLPNPEQWQVTPVTASLLRHWRALQEDVSRSIRPFFCQLEAVETAIWLAEVAPKSGRRGRRYLDWLKEANASATAADGPALFRVALKLATGAGKTTVMAMLIAWQAINAARARNSKHFSRGFLIITPGITIRDRLRVLLPNEPDNYYRRLDLVPTDLMQDMGAAKIVITNYHSFKPRERVQLAKGTREALKGHGEDVETQETEGQMLQRVMKELMGLGPLIVINDEAHHCYRQRPEGEAAKLTAEEKAEAKENEEAARLWISGIEGVKRQLGLNTVYDLSATPFFLAGSGWPEGTLFPWVVSDFSLMDAIECGIVKLPRVPVADNLASGRTPLYRNLWPTIRDKMPKKGRGALKPDPLKIPIELQTALEALYGHYRKTYDAWAAKKIGVPPVFIVVCNDTVNSETVANYIAGFERETKEGDVHFHQGRLELFRNYTDEGDRLARPRTLLIDSQRIDSGEAIDPKFRDAYEDELDAFRREKAAREGADAARTLTDEDILREVLNTVGKEGKLGAEIRCVVSVSMLTEGWDANTVTHILGLRAFSTKLICEQVIGRALRRLSYDVDPATGLFGVEYADIMGIDDLNFSAQAIAAPVKPPKEVIHVQAVSPERDHLEIDFPRVEGFRVELPDERLTADYSKLEPYILDPDKVGATEVTMQGIVGMPEKLTLDYLKAMRPSEIVFKLATHLLTEKLRDADEEPKLHLFPQCQRLVKQWLDQGLLVCKGGTVRGQVTYKQLADEVTDQIAASINVGAAGETVVRAILDPYAPTGSTMDVSFNVTKADLYDPNPDKSHINWIVLDSDWEGQCAQVIEDHPRVLAYAKNHNLGFEVPYLAGGEPRRYRPDFLLRIDDGGDTPLTLVLEVKGFRGHDVPLKTAAMRDRWIPAVERLGRFGRWAFGEMSDPYRMKEELDALIMKELGREAA